MNYHRYESHKERSSDLVLKFAFTKTIEKKLLVKILVFFNKENYLEIASF
jgi:hypothetical protein